MTGQFYRTHKLFFPITLMLFALPFFVPILGAQTPAGGTTKIDPCSMLTKTEIQEILGKPVQDGKLNTNANPAVGQPCQYVVGDYGAFSILIKPLGAGETPARIQDALNKSKMKTVDAPGIGDKSFFAFPGYGMIQLNTFKGTQYILITLMIPGLSEDATKAGAEKLMKKILPKI